MKKIVWSDKIRTGNKYIDLQHQDLIDLINEFAEVVEAGAAPQQVTGVLHRLENYVLFHFHTEENLMANRRISHEHTQRHILAHQRFSENIQSYKAGIQVAKPEEIVIYLVTWLTEHIERTDQELARLLAG